MKASCAAWILALAHASVAAPLAPLAAQDRYSARLAGLNVNLAGILPDPLTDPWRNPARWTKAATVYGLFRAAKDREEDFFESGATFPVTRGGAIAGRFVTGPGDDVGARAYVGSTSVGFGSGKASSGVRFDIVNDPDRVEAWGYAAAAGFLITTTSLGRFEVWGEYQRPRTGSSGEGTAAELVLSSPHVNAAEERLEPVILLRGGRHTGEEFGILARGPVTWYEASIALRRSWGSPGGSGGGSAAGGSAGVFAVSLRRGEWKARTRCADPEQLCGAINDPTVGNHQATAVDAAVEFPFASLRLRAGGTWPLDGSRKEYEDPWPAELRTAGALRPGTAEGLFFGAAWKLAPRVEVDAHGYPLFLDDDGASRRVGRYGIQVSVKL